MANEFDSTWRFKFNVRANYQVTGFGPQSISNLVLRFSCTVDSNILKSWGF